MKRTILLLIVFGLFLGYKYAVFEARVVCDADNDYWYEQQQLCVKCDPDTEKDLGLYSDDANQP